MHARSLEWWNAISLRTKITGVTVAAADPRAPRRRASAPWRCSQPPARSGQLDAQAAPRSQAPATSTTIAAVLRQRHGRADGELADYFVAVYDTDGNAICDNCDSREAPGPRPATLTLAQGKQPAAGRTTYRSNDGHTHSARSPSGVAHDRHDRHARQRAIVATSTCAETDTVIGQLLGDLPRLRPHRHHRSAPCSPGCSSPSTFAPLREVEETAVAIAAGDFSQRLTRRPRTPRSAGSTAPSTRCSSRIDRAFADRAAHHRPDAPLRRRRQPRAAHAAGLRARLRRALPDGRAADARGRRAGDGAHREGGDPHGRARRGSARARPPRRGEAARARARSTWCRSPGTPRSTRWRRAPTASSRWSTPDADRARRPTTPPLDLVAPITAPDAARESPNATGPIAFAGATLARLRSPPRRADAGVPPRSTSPTGDAAPQRRADPPIVLGEENKIRQVVTNLMGNAIRFTADDSPIEIGVRSTTSAASRHRRSSTTARASRRRSARRSSSASGAPTPRAPARPAAAASASRSCRRIVARAQRHRRRSSRPRAAARRSASRCRSLAAERAAAGAAAARRPRAASTRARRCAPIRLRAARPARCTAGSARVHARAVGCEPRRLRPRRDCNRGCDRVCRHRAHRGRGCTSHRTAPARG